MQPSHILSSGDLVMVNPVWIDRSSMSSFDSSVDDRWVLAIVVLDSGVMGELALYYIDGSLVRRYKVIMNVVKVITSVQTCE